MNKFNQAHFRGKITQTVSPRKFIQISKNPSAIRSSRIVPPKLGGKDLGGKIVVEFNH